MNTELHKSTIKGKEEILLVMWPEGNLETEFFNQLFSGEVEFEATPNSNGQIVVRKKVAPLLTTTPT